jgi:hypothetical protein
VVASDPVVALVLLSQSEMERYGSALKQVFPVSETPCFGELLRLIDEADREHWGADDRKAALGNLRVTRVDS